LLLLTVSVSIRIHQAPAWPNHYRDGSPEQQLKNRPGTNQPETTGLGQARLVLLITRMILRVKGEIVFFSFVPFSPIRPLSLEIITGRPARLEDLCAEKSCGMTLM
jgi:hypothetical protein